jgi:glycine/D-amino acid oxidase-like deaminating enzyme
MLHWNPTDATLSFDPRLSPSTPEARDLVRRARQLLPSIGEVEPEAVRIAIRPIPGDQLSAIGPMPRTSGYYIALGARHHGKPVAIEVKLAALSALRDAD